MAPPWLTSAHRVHPRRPFWQRHHCGYCDFAVAAGQDHLIDLYVEAISAELATLGTPQPVWFSCSLGGGTPTHLSTPQLERLLAAVTRLAVFVFRPLPLREEGQRGKRAAREGSNVTPCAAGSLTRRRSAATLSPKTGRGQERGILPGSEPGFAHGGESSSHGRVWSESREPRGAVVSGAVASQRSDRTAFARTRCTGGRSGPQAHSAWCRSTSSLGARGHARRLGGRSRRERSRLHHNICPRMDLTYEKGTPLWEAVGIAGSFVPVAEESRTRDVRTRDGPPRRGRVRALRDLEFRLRNFRCRHNERYWANEA